MSTKTSIPKDLLTNYDMTFMFDKTIQTIYKWRWEKGLPAHKIPANGLQRLPVRFSLAEIVEWADRNNIEIKRMPIIKDDGSVEWTGPDVVKFKKMMKETKK